MFHFLAESSFQQITESTWLYLVKGGIFMIPLMLCLLAGVTIIVFKFLTLRKESILPSNVIAAVKEFEVDVSKLKDVQEKISKGESPLGRLVKVLSGNQHKTQVEMTEAVQTAARYEILYLNSGMSALSVVIEISPLFGLLGTASGLAAMFSGMGDTNNTQAIALGIAEALNTTIVGLAITVPCVVTQSFFNRKIEMLTVQLEILMGELVDVYQKLKL
jgi:biopolymer transport protein ExbB